ncbi:hypothetical protein PAPYR_3377 [Paratrimastix pyriformis]|uniref:At4g15545-like C-terminal domain-containing protein n=1 Tax=Paratrimastix pyriformis TaxID=342808 RepID=A0ABQ8UMF4_9EUKA|nr:hypothetical protein PAPYR_3377 [Paratrimastix pyriformis]
MWPRYQSLIVSSFKHKLATEPTPEQLLSEGLNLIQSAFAAKVKSLTQEVRSVQQTLKTKDEQIQKQQKQLYLLTLQCEEQAQKIQQLQKQNQLIVNEKQEIENILRKYKVQLMSPETQAPSTDEDKPTDTDSSPHEAPSSVESPRRQALPQPSSDDYLSRLQQSLGRTYARIQAGVSPRPASPVELPAPPFEGDAGPSAISRRAALPMGQSPSAPFESPALQQRSAGPAPSPHHLLVRNSPHPQPTPRSQQQQQPQRLAGDEADMSDDLSGGGSSARAPEGLQPAPSPAPGGGSGTPSRRPPIPPLALTALQQQQAGSSFASAHTPSTAIKSPKPMGPQAKEEGRRLFALVRSRLSPERFASFLGHIRALNQRMESRQVAMQGVAHALGEDNRDLFEAFQGLVDRVSSVDEQR